jgi:hypothetical protein
VSFNGAVSCIAHDKPIVNFRRRDETIGPKKRNSLDTLSVSAEVIDHVIKIIENIS